MSNIPLANSTSETDDEAMASHLGLSKNYDDDVENEDDDDGVRHIDNAENDFLMEYLHQLNDTKEMFFNLNSKKTNNALLSTSATSSSTSSSSESTSKSRRSYNSCEAAENKRFYTPASQLAAGNENYFMASFSETYNTTSQIQSETLTLNYQSNAQNGDSEAEDEDGDEVEEAIYEIDQDNADEDDEIDVDVDEDANVRLESSQSSPLPLINSPQSILIPQLPQLSTHNNTTTIEIKTNLNQTQSSQTSLATNPFVFNDNSNSCKILEGLNKLRLDNSLCDIVLKVENEEFNCHKCVLSSLSDYFRVMFSCELAESKQTIVSFNDIDANIMKSIIDYAYTSQLIIHENNVEALLKTANLFVIKQIKDACCRYMEWHMDEFNCVGVHCLSEPFDCFKLKCISFNFILTNFCKVILHDEFLSLQKSKLIEIISDDNLNVPNEDIVFNACMKWLDFAPDTRSFEFYQILEHIRLPLLSAYFLYDKVQCEQRLKQCDKSRELIQEALMYNLLKDRRNQVQNERTRSRKSFTHLEALIVVGGEDDRLVLRTVDAYFPLINRWIPLQCSPSALSKHGTVAGGENMLYMAGGESPDSNPYDTFWVYNSVLDEWKELASLQTPRSELGMAIVDGCVYAVGGTNGDKRLSTTERYDPLLNAWKYCAPMKVSIASPAVCSLNGLLYVIGGTVVDDDSDQEQSIINNIVQCYNPATDTWKELASMTIPRIGCGVCSFNGFIYVIGGWQPSPSHISNSVEYYDPVVDKWYACKDLIEKRHRPGVAVLNNKIYVCGGEEGFSMYHDSIECYNTYTNEWELCTSMTSGRSWLSCATLRLQNPLLDSDRYELLD